jgi:hypothetical protein
MGSKHNSSLKNSSHDEARRAETWRVGGIAGKFK